MAPEVCDDGSDFARSSRFAHRQLSLALALLVAHVDGDAKQKHRDEDYWQTEAKPEAQSER